MNVAYDSTSSKFNFQVARLKVKVTLDIFRKKKMPCRHSSLCVYQCILIYLQTSVGHHNISSKFDFQGPGFKVKVDMTETIYIM